MVEMSNDKSKNNTKKKNVILLRAKLYLKKSVKCWIQLTLVKFNIFIYFN